MEAKKANQVQTLSGGSIDYHHYANVGSLARNAELKRLSGKVSDALASNRATLSTFFSIVLLVILF